MNKVTARIVAPISSTERAARTHCLAVLAAIVGTVAGCATPDQLHKTEVQQVKAVEQLRAGVDRSDSALAGQRTEIERTQESVRRLEIDLTAVRARSDAAQAQADQALLTSREFLANLLAAREEQRRQLDANGVAFAELKRKLADLDVRLQAQQRLLEQNATVLNDASRRLQAVETGLQEGARRSALLEARAKAGQDANEGMTRQLAALHKQVEETRAAVSSSGLMQMMRELEDVRRNSASLRGSIEELQKAQADAATQARNHYLDLDSRLRQLKQSAAPKVRETDLPAAAAPEPAAASDQSGNQ